MDKNKIKAHLFNRFISEAATPGIDVTAKVKKESDKINKDGIKAIDKEVKAYDKAVKQTASETSKMAPNKFNYNSDREKTYHDEMEIMNGQEMIQYDREPNDEFKKRAEESIEGSSRMGNLGGIPNAEATWGASSDTFGKDLVKKVKDSQKKRADADRAYLALGDDIELLPRKEKGKGKNYSLKEGKINENEELGAGYTHFAIRIADNKIVDGWDYSGVDKQDIKYYAKEDLISNFPDNKPSDFRVVTRGILTKNGVNPADTNNWYKITEASGNPYGSEEENDFNNQQRTAEPQKNEDPHRSKMQNNTNNPQIKESMKRIKFNKLFNGVGNALKLIPESYKVEDKVFEMTDGNESYKIRWEGNLSEGRAVILTASDKTLVTEDISRMKALFRYKSQDTLGLVKGNARIDENAAFADVLSKTKKLLGESEDIENQTASEGDLDDAVKSAPEAKKHVEGSVSTEKGTKAPAPKKGNFDDITKKAPEATKHVEGSVSTEKGTKAPAPKQGEWDKISVPQAAAHGDLSSTTYAPTPKQGEWDKISVPQASDAKKHIHMNESEEEEVEALDEENIGYGNDNALKGKSKEEKDEMLSKQPVYSEDVSENVLMKSKSTGKYYIVNENKTILCPNNLVESAKKDVNKIFNKLNITI